MLYILKEGNTIVTTPSFVLEYATQIAVNYLSLGYFKNHCGNHQELRNNAGNNNDPLQTTLHPQNLLPQDAVSCYPSICAAVLQQVLPLQFCVYFLFLH